MLTRQVDACSGAGVGNINTPCLASENVATFKHGDRKSALDQLMCSAKPAPTPPPRIATLQDMVASLRNKDLADGWNSDGSVTLGWAPANPKELVALGHSEHKRTPDKPSYAWTEYPLRTSRLSIDSVNFDAPKVPPLSRLSQVRSLPRSPFSSQANIFFLSGHWQRYTRG